MKRTPKKSIGKKKPAKKPHANSSDPAGAAVFSAYPKPLKAKLLALRRLIFNTARSTNGVGALQETLKWGSRVISRRRRKAAAPSGIDRVNSAANRYAIYFHCQTDLVETFRKLYPTEFSHGGNRSPPPRTLIRCYACAIE
jgi:hypothetical protein